MRHLALMTRAPLVDCFLSHSDEPNKAAASQNLTSAAVHWQGGAIKLYKGLACPLCSYELLLFSLAGEDGKTFPLCPCCYNNPLEGAPGKVSLCL